MAWALHTWVRQGLYIYKTNCYSFEMWLRNILLLYSRCLLTCDAVRHLNPLLRSCYCCHSLTYVTSNVASFSHLTSHMWNRKQRFLLLWSFMHRCTCIPTNYSSIFLNQLHVRSNKRKQECPFIIRLTVNVTSRKIPVCIGSHWFTYLFLQIIVSLESFKVLY